MSQLRVTSYVVSTVALWANASFALVLPEPAPSCLSDADCGAGSQCVVSSVAPDCAEPAPLPADGTGATAGFAPPATGGMGATGGTGATGATEPACDVAAPVYGTCQALPDLCDSDADCDEYLSCVSTSSSGGCAVLDTTTDCVPEGESVSQCQVVLRAGCTTDSDCPREFTCMVGAAGDVACGGTTGSGAASSGADCVAPEPEATSYCAPREISCYTDAECPTDWLCSLSGGGGSAGGASSVGGSTSTEPAPAKPAAGGSADGALPADPAPVPMGGASTGEGTPGMEPPPGYCAPAVWLSSGMGGGGTVGGGGASNGGGDDVSELPQETGTGGGGETDPGPGKGTSSPSGTATFGGCSVATTSQAPGLGSLAGLLALPLLLRRRRSAAVQR